MSQTEPSAGVRRFSVGQAGAWRWEPEQP